MDHKTAETIQAVERYTLDELPEQERDQFEEHLFDCPICSELVRQNFTIAENLKQVFVEDSVRASSKLRTNRSAWREWFRVPSLVPTLAALSLGALLLYQNTGHNAAEDARVLPPASIMMPVSRGESLPSQLVDPKSGTFLMTFSVDAARPDSFTCEFDDSTGRKVLQLTTGPETTTSFNLPVQLSTAKFPPGRYQMVLRPASEPDSIKSYPFVIEYSK